MKKSPELKKKIRMVFEATGQLVRIDKKLLRLDLSRDLKSKTLKVLRSQIYITEEEGKFIFKDLWGRGRPVKITIEIEK